MFMIENIKAKKDVIVYEKAEAKHISEEMFEIVRSNWQIKADK